MFYTSTILPERGYEPLLGIGYRGGHSTVECFDNIDMQQTMNNVLRQNSYRSMT